MLVLSRKKMESIRIGDEIEVVVLEVAKNRVRLGFRCPPHISITREELRNFEKEVTVPVPEGAKVDRELVLA